MQYAVFVNRFLWELFSREQLADAVAYAREHNGELYDCIAGKPVDMETLTPVKVAQPARPQSAAAARVAKAEALYMELMKRRNPAWKPNTSAR